MGGGRRGFRFEASGDEESQSAARVLSRQLFRQYGHLPHTWITEDEPRLPVEWRRLGGLANTRVVLSPAELEAIEEAIEAVLAPSVTREPADRPTDGRGVRLMRYVLPEASSGDAVDS